MKGKWEGRSEREMEDGGREKRSGKEREGWREREKEWEGKGGKAGGREGRRE